MKILNKIALLAIAVATLASCNKDDFTGSDAGPSLKAEGVADIPGSSPLTGPWVLSANRNGAFGWPGDYIPFASLPATPASLTGGHANEYSIGGRSANGFFYTLNNNNTGARGIRRFSVSTSSITQADFLSAGGSAAAQDRKSVV